MKDLVEKFYDECCTHPRGVMNTEVKLPPNEVFEWFQENMSSNPLVPPRIDRVEPMTRKNALLIPRVTCPYAQTVESGYLVVFENDDKVWVPAVTHNAEQTAPSPATDQWTNEDIDTTYIMGLINASAIKIPKGETMPSMHILGEEGARLKKMGFSAPHEMIRVIHKPTQIESK